MSAGQDKIYIEQGSDFVMKMRFKLPDGTGRDLTGHKFTGALRKTATEKGAPAARFTFDLPDQNTDDARGVCVARIPAAENVLIPVAANKTAVKVSTDYAWDIRSTDPTGKVMRWLEGIATISPAVDRPDLP